MCAPPATRIRRGPERGVFLQTLAAQNERANQYHGSIHGCRSNEGVGDTVTFLVLGHRGCRDIAITLPQGTYSRMNDSAHCSCGNVVEHKVRLATTANTRAAFPSSKQPKQNKTSKTYTSSGSPNKRVTSRIWRASVMSQTDILDEPDLPATASRTVPLPPPPFPRSNPAPGTA